MIDIDQFKEINDRCGHQVGDEILRRLTSIVTGAIRQSVDVFARLGGDEFVILAPETGAYGAGVLAERLRQSIEQGHFLAGGQLAPFTASFGVATAEGRHSADSVEEMLRRADESLYLSKKNGRNRVTFFGDGAGEAS